MQEVYREEAEAERKYEQAKEERLKELKEQRRQAIEDNRVAASFKGNPSDKDSSREEVNKLSKEIDRLEGEAIWLAQ